MKRLSRNVLAIAASDIGRRLLGFLAIAYLARKVGTAGFGAVNVGLTVLSYAVMASTAGLNTFGTRATAQGTLGDSTPSILGLRMVNALAAFLAVVVVAECAVTNHESSVLIMLFAISLIAHALLLDWYFQGKESMGIVGIGRMLSAVVYLVILLAFVRSPADIGWIALGTIAGDFLNAGLLLAAYRRQGGRVMPSFGAARWLPMMRQSFPLGYGSILAHISVNLPTVIIGVMLTNADVGVYSAANKLVAFLLVFDRVLATLLLPASARFHATSPDTLPGTLSTALKWIVVVALPITVGGSMLGDGIVRMVFGSQYEQAVPVFRILIWYFFWTMIHTVYTSAMIAVGGERTYGKVMAASAAIYCVSILILTSQFGLAGAAAGMVISEAATLTMMRKGVMKLVRIPAVSSSFRIILSSAVMAGAIYLLPQVHVVVAVAVGAIVYGLSLVFTGAVTQQEIADLMSRV